MTFRSLHSSVEQTIYLEFSCTLLHAVRTLLNSAPVLFLSPLILSVFLLKGVLSDNSDSATLKPGILSFKIIYYNKAMEERI